jgi:hypothetical protein
VGKIIGVRGGRVGFVLTEWLAFVRKSKPEMVLGSLDAILEDEALFLMPVVSAAHVKEIFACFWPPGGP